jgi:hypothetical protein
MKANIRSANATTTNYATLELLPHTYTQKFSPVTGQGEGKCVSVPQKVVASILPPVPNPEDRLVEARPGGLLDSLTNRPHEGASTQTLNIDCSVRQRTKS